MHLKNGQPDQAITVLERAINLNPGSGQNYYYLADAWLMKKNLAQAAECNNLAADYFEGDPSWMARVTEQKKRIQALLKSP
jgi:tetratricopeptide (TPR) repeat protein